MTVLRNEFGLSRDALVQPKVIAVNLLGNGTASAELTSGGKV